MDSMNDKTYQLPFHALSLAIWKNDVEKVKQLVPIGTDVRTGFGNHWSLALGLRRAAIVEYFASFDNEVFSYDIDECVSHGDLKCLMGIIRTRDLSRSRTGDNAETSLSLGFEILLYAVRHSNLDVLEAFLPLIASEINKDFTPKMFSLIKPELKLGSTILHEAAARPSVEIVGELVRAGANVYHMDLDGSSILHAAAKNGTSETFAFLVLHDVPVQSRNSSGYNALDVALLHNNTPVIRLLIVEHQSKPAKEPTASHFHVLRQAFLDADMEFVFDLLKAGFQFDDKMFEMAMKTLHSHEVKALLKSMDSSALEVMEPLSASKTLPTVPGSHHGITKQASDWLHRCLSTHGMCRLAEIDVPLLPTRVLEIHKEQLYCRLVESANQRAHYFTLSHRWQGNKMYRTTLKNLPLHYKAIDISKLSGPIRFAIKLTSAIGMKYLWFDALCIIQDSDTDKNVEIMKMADIYSKSCLTIAIIDHKNMEINPTQTRTSLIL